MEIIETGDPDAFKQYLQEYENTICGRHPISVLLHVSGSFFDDSTVTFYLVSFEQLIL
jgi:predicted class III extradiol MEMO1 family dioxygenase